eukprot:jgi/Mesvir1/1361/Mv12282-RA.1
MDAIARTGLHGASYLKWNERGHFLHSNLMPMQNLTKMLCSMSTTPCIAPFSASHCHAPQRACTRNSLGSNSSSGLARPMPRRAHGELKPSRSQFRFVTRAAADGEAEEENPWAKPGYKGAVVSQWPEPAQAAAVAAIFSGLGVGTAFCCTQVGPWFAQNLPWFYHFSEATWPIIGVPFIAAGVAHFGMEKGFLDMYPHRGAWGIFYLPGSPSFHVQWTGVAEVLGGVGVVLGGLPFASGLVPDWVPSLSAWGLFLLTWAVTPANIYMFTHNAPGPLPEGVDVPTLTWQGHLARGAAQVLLLSFFWALAHKEMIS